MEHSLVRKILFAVAVLYTTGITVGSLIKPVQFVEKPFDYFDKLLHAGAYFGMALLWIGVVFFARKLGSKANIFAIITFLVIVYGIIIEALQGSLTTYRTADVWDIVANSLGAVLAFVLLLIFKRKLELLKSKF